MPIRDSADTSVLHYRSSMSLSDQRPRVFFSFDSRDFPAMLKAARKARGWTQVQLAQEADVNAETINRIERGMNTRISTMAKIRKALPDLAGSNGEVQTGPHVETQLRVLAEQDKQKAELESLRDQVIHLIRAVSDAEQLERVRHFTLHQLTRVEALRGKATVKTRRPRK